MEYFFSLSLTQNISQLFLQHKEAADYKKMIYDKIIVISIFLDYSKLIKHKPDKWSEKIKNVAMVSVLETQTFAKRRSMIF